MILTLCSSYIHFMLFNLKLWGFLLSSISFLFPCAALCPGLKLIKAQMQTMNLSKEVSGYMYVYIYELTGQLF